MSPWDVAEGNRHAAAFSTFTGVRYSAADVVRRLRPLRTIAWLCLLLQLSGGAMAFGTVLCVASDGHLAVETAHAGACETETRRHHDEHGAGLTDACSGHPCVDIALAETAGRASTRTGDELLAGPSPVDVLPQASGVAATTWHRQGRGTPTTDDPRLVAHRTVVLRN
jgi:hypothetical protein